MIFCAGRGPSTQSGRPLLEARGLLGIFGAGVVAGMSVNLEECEMADDNNTNEKNEHNERETNGVRICMCFAARVRTWVPWHGRDVPCGQCAWSKDEQERQATHVCDRWQGQCCCVHCSTSQGLHMSATQKTPWNFVPLINTQAYTHTRTQTNGQGLVRASASAS